MNTVYFATSRLGEAEALASYVTGVTKCYCFYSMTYMSNKSFFKCNKKATFCPRTAVIVTTNSTS